MRSLLMSAYAVPRDQVSGPSWIDSERYDIVAKVPSGLTRCNGISSRDWGASRGFGPDWRRRHVSRGSRTAPSMFSAFQALGLKLAPARTPVKTVVVDAMDKKPTEN